MCQYPQQYRRQPSGWPVQVPEQPSCFGIFIMVLSPNYSFHLMVIECARICSVVKSCSKQVKEGKRSQSVNLQSIWQDRINLFCQMIWGSHMPNKISPVERLTPEDSAGAHEQLLLTLPSASRGQLPREYLVWHVCIFWILWENRVDTKWLLVRRRRSRPGSWGH
jgi:hypothetical protein